MGSPGTRPRPQSDPAISGVAGGAARRRRALPTLARIATHSAGPRQNRVDPFGNLAADPARGSLLGNRGCLHDEHGDIQRFHKGNRWIFCELEFKNRRRELMQPGQYTELFFLDEATAFAAGHRPCMECMRERAVEFRDAWAATNLDTDGNFLGVPMMDAVLQRGRIDADGNKVTSSAKLSSLPDGVIVVPEPGAGPAPARRAAPAPVELRRLRRARRRARPARRSRS